MNMVDTLKGSYFSEVLPEGWDISKIYDCVSNDPSSVGERQSFWNDGFRPVECTNLEEFGAYMGHEIAMQIRLTKEEGRKLILILPVGPMGMYKWAVYFLKEWNVSTSTASTWTSGLTPRAIRCPHPTPPRSRTP